MRGELSPARSSSGDFAPADSCGPGDCPGHFSAGAGVRRRVHPVRLASVSCVYVWGAGGESAAEEDKDLARLGF